jgi:hypothetical protein
MLLRTPAAAPAQWREQRRAPEFFLAYGLVLARRNGQREGRICGGDVSPTAVCHVGPATRAR